jgi:hypothetical protein
MTVDIYDLSGPSTQTVAEPADTLKLMFIIAMPVVMH